MVKVEGGNKEAGLLKPRTLEGIRFIRCAAVITASPRYCLGTLLVSINDRATSKRCRFLLSNVILLRCIYTSQLTHNPIFRKIFLKILSIYSMLLSLRRTRIFALNQVLSSYRRIESNHKLHSCYIRDKSKSPLKNNQ